MTSSAQSPLRIKDRGQEGQGRKEADLTDVLPSLPCEEVPSKASQKFCSWAPQPHRCLSRGWGAGSLCPAFVDHWRNIIQNGVLTLNDEVKFRRGDLKRPEELHAVFPEAAKQRKFCIPEDTLAHASCVPFPGCSENKGWNWNWICLDWTKDLPVYHTPH